MTQVYCERVHKFAKHRWLWFGAFRLWQASCGIKNKSPHFQKTINSYNINCVFSMCDYFASFEFINLSWPAWILPSSFIYFLFIAFHLGGIVDEFFTWCFLEGQLPPLKELCRHGKSVRYGKYICRFCSRMPSRRRRTVSKYTVHRKISRRWFEVQHGWEEYIMCSSAVQSSQSIVKWGRVQSKYIEDTLGNT